MPVLYEGNLIAIHPFEPVFPGGCRPEPVVELAVGFRAQLIDRDIAAEMIAGIAVPDTGASLLAGCKQRKRKDPQEEGAD